MPLIVVAVVGIVAGVVTLGVTTHDDQACNAEYRTVQAALDAYMAGNNLTSVPAGLRTNNMTNPVPLYHSAAPMTDPSYVRNSQSQFAYTWDSSGHITAISRAAGGPPLTPGCVVVG